MKITKEQIAKWSAEITEQNPRSAELRTQSIGTVSREQIAQWGQEITAQQELYNQQAQVRQAEKDAFREDAKNPMLNKKQEKTATPDWLNGTTRIYGTLGKESKNQPFKIEADAVGKNVLSGMTLSAAQSADGGVARSSLSEGAKNQGSITGEPSVEEGKGTATLGARRGTSLTGAQELLERTGAELLQSPDGDSSLREGALRPHPSADADTFPRPGEGFGKEGTQGLYGQAVQKLEESLSARREEEQFDKLNAWMEQEGNRELVRLIRTGKNVTPYAAESHAMQPVSVSGAAGERHALSAAQSADGGVAGSSPEGRAESRGKNAYSDAELIAKGYTQQQIDEARQYIAEFDALPAWKRAAQRTSDTIEGIGSTVAAAIPLAGEYMGQSAWNFAGTQGNLQTLWQELEGDNRARALYAYLNGTDVDGNAYTDEAIRSMGYTQSEIDSMRARIQGSYVTDGIGPEESVGYQLYKHGAGMNELAQRGMSDVGKTLQGVVSSAAENLAVSAINPALVLPVLSAQGGAEAMGQSVEKGEDAGKALAGGLAKFAAGWGINSVGAAQLAHAMGSDYAKDTLAGQIAKWVRELAGEGSLAANYPTIANALSGGVDNAMQAFVETYADMAIDALLGDDEQAAALFEPETFITALQSGLSGGASGALGGAVGTQLARVYDGETSFAAVREKLLQSAQSADSIPLFVADGDIFPRPGEVFLSEGDLSQKRETGSTTGDGMPSQQTLSAAQSADGGVARSSPKGGAKNQGSDSSLSEGALRPHPSADADTFPRPGEGLSQKGGTGTKKAPAETQTTRDHTDVRYSIQVDTDGKEFVQIDSDILDGVSPENELSVVRDAIRDLFPDGFERDGKKIDNTREGRSEFVRSKYSKMLEKNTPEVHSDKMRMASNLDEIISTSGDVKYEEAHHKNAEGFNRGTVNVRVGGNDYSVDVLTAIKNDGREVAYDVVNIQPTTIKASDAEHPKPSGRSGESVTSPAEGGNRRSPESPLSAEAKTTVQESTGSSSAQNPTTNIAPGGEGVKGENGTLRETVGLAEGVTLTEKQRKVQRSLKTWGVSEKGALSISRNVPESVSDVSRYAAAASSLYRLGQMQDVKTFEQALELAGGMKNLAPNTNYVLANNGGRTALQLAYTQGKGEAQMAALGGEVSGESTQGTGRVRYQGTTRTATEAASQLIELNARGTATDAVMKNVLEDASGRPDSGVRACVDTETAKIFFGDAAEDVFGAVLHEDWHWYNTLDRAGAQQLQEMALEYLAKDSGFETVDELIRAKMEDYALQGLTYEQAAEELVGDAWRGIFDDESSFERWVKFQQGQAEKNASQRGTIQKVMNAVKQLLNNILTKAKEILQIQPDSRAAKQAQRMAQEYKEILQDAYFAHAEQAMENLRAAKENAAALNHEGAAEIRFQLHEGKDSLSEQMNDRLDELSEMKTVAQVKEQTVSFGKSRNENIQNITEYFDSIGNKVARAGFGVVELVRKGARTTVQHGNSAAKQAAVAAIPAVIEKGKQIGYERNWQGRGYDTYVFAAPVEIDGTKVYEGVIVNAYEHDGRKVFYVHEVCWTDGSYVKFGEDGKLTKKEDTSTQLPKAVLSHLSETRDVSSKKSIAQSRGENKLRFQLEEQAERNVKKNEQQQASRSIAEKAAALDTLSQFFGLTRGVKVTQSSMEALASRWAKANGSRIDRAKLARETEVLVDYLKADGADMTKAQSLAETLAGEVLEEATYRNSELWDEYPELHKLEYTVDKNGKAKAELVKQYGSWSEAVAEARRHGVTLRQQEGIREANQAEMYESLVNDTRAVGGTKDGAAALWKAAAEKAGVAGAASMEGTEWLNVLMNLHDAIKPKMMSRFEDVAEYEDAKIELAGRMIGDIVALPELTDAQAIFEGIMQHNLAVAKAAAGDERAAEVTKGLRTAQKAQEKAFDQRLRQNRREANQNDPAVRQMQQNQRAEQQLDKTLETLGVDITNVGDLNEKLTVLREEYERELKAEKKRLQEQRQEMLDEIRLDYKLKALALKEQNSELKWELKQEMRRADKAEYQLIVQENEILEWEEESQRKAQQWQETQAKRNAEAISLAQQQRDEDVAAAKQLAEKRVQKAREARKMEELRRGIRSDAQKLNQMLLKPQKDKFVQRQLVAQAAQVAKLASETVLNQNAVDKLAALESTIRQVQGTESNANEMTWDWKQSGVADMLGALRADLNGAKEAKLTKLHEQLADAQQLPYSEQAQMLIERLEKRIRETERRSYLPLTVEQLRTLKAITNATLHVIRNANKTVSLAEAKEIEQIALGAAEEVRTSKGNSPGGKWDGVHRLLTKYQLDMLGAKRVFRMLGGYATNGQMEMLADALNDGQLRQTEIQMGGEKLFADVTGKENLTQIKKFAGPGAEMVDLGIGAEVNHAQMCSLYMHLKNKNSREHLMRGGMVIPDMKLYNAGDIEGAYQKGKTVTLGHLFTEGTENPAGTIIERIEQAMTDYDRAWCADMETFFGEYTTNLINETSMKLLGYQRATEKNYYPIAVDKSKLASQVEGVIMDATIEGRGFLKSRQKSGLPILLEECQNVVQRSLKDTAAYAGLAAPIRDVQKVLNTQVQTSGGTATLKNGLIKEHWGKDAVGYIDDLLTDLQTVQRKRSNSVTRVMSKVRGNYAGAVLTLNPGVAIAQAASLPTAAAVLGSDTMASVLPFVKNFSEKQRAAVEAEIAEHSPLLAYRLKGSKRGELASIGQKTNAAQRMMDALPKQLTGWITGMDEITVAALWEGSKRYVQNHTGEFGTDAATVGSEDYWDAVTKTYQKVIEETQPNYTTMQRSGIQRNPDEMAKTFTAFTTQRFQNYGILADAVGEYRAKGDAYDRQLKAAAQENVRVQRAQETVDKTRAALEQAKAALEQAKLAEKDKAELEYLEAKAKGYESGLQSLEAGLEGEKAEAAKTMEKVKAIEEEQTRAKKQLKRALGSQVVQTAVFAAMKIGADFLLHRWDREQDENGDVTALAVAQRFASLAAESAAGNFLFGSELYSLVDNLWNDGDYDVVSVSSASALNEIASAAVRFSTEMSRDTAEMTDTELEAHHEKLKKYGMSLIGEIMDCEGIPYSNAKKIVDAVEAYIEDGIALAKGEGFSFNGAPESATGQYDRLYNAYLNGDAEEAQAALGKLELLGKTDKVYSELKKRLKKNETIAEAAQKTNAGDWEGRKDIIDREEETLKTLLGDDSSEVRDVVVEAVDAVANQMLIDERGGGEGATVYTAMLDELESGDAKRVQSEIDRLLKAGKTVTNLKSKITAAMKPEYAAGSDYDQKQIEEMLTGLTDADGKKLYEKKTIRKWGEEEEEKEDRYDLLK